MGERLPKIKTATALLVLAGVLGLGGFAGKTYVTADDLSPPLTKGELRGAVERQGDSTSKKENDLRLPKGPPPVQVYVSVVDDTLVLKRRTTGYNSKTTLDASGRPTTSFVPFEYVSKNLFGPNDLKMALKMVLEVQHSGQRILDSKEWFKRIKGETLALVVEDDFDPAHLRLIKEGTLVFVAQGKYVVAPNPQAPLEAQPLPVQPPPAVASVIEPLPVPPPPPADVGPLPPPNEGKSAKLPDHWLNRQNNISAEESADLHHDLFTAAQMKFDVKNYSEALRRYKLLQDKYRKKVEGLIACQKIWHCVEAMQDFPTLSQMAHGHG